MAAAAGVPRKVVPVVRGNLRVAATALVLGVLTFAPSLSWGQVRRHRQIEQDHRGVLWITGLSRHARKRQTYLVRAVTESATE